MDKNLLEKISYKTKYFNSVDELIEKIVNKTIVPYQLEVQPGRLKGKKICWMPCSYCYGGSSENNSEKLSHERYLDILDQVNDGPNGGIKKIIYAGYATDPLNYEYIDDFIEKSINYKQIFGVHSKLLKVSDRLVKLLQSNSVMETSYLTISVDGGDDKSYNLTHNLSSGVKLYNKVLENIKKITEHSNQNKSKLDISANYLITKVNSDRDIVFKGINDLIRSGVDSIRLSFPQIPRGMNSEAGSIIPSLNEANNIYKNLLPVIKEFEDLNLKVILMHYDKDKNITEPRTLPCFARFIYPAIAYDGYLSNCSQSAAVHFRDMSLGNLQTTDFWDAFYDYDSKNLFSFMKNQFKKMVNNDCRCDRKEHTVNQIFKEELDLKFA